MQDRYRLVINDDVIVTKNTYDEILNAYVRRCRRLEDKILERNDYGARFTIEIREIYESEPILTKTIIGRDVLYGR